MREIVFLCAEQEAEHLSDVLLDLGVLSVSVEDANENTDQERPLYGEPGLEPEVLAWDKNRVVALLPEDLDPEQLVQALRDQQVVALDDQDWFLREVPDNDWVRLTQSQFGPIEVGDKILIVPSWHAEDEIARDAQAQDKVCIELDPGLAFGTGSHPTTHLCLEWLADHLQAGQTVLDYGCGSGILAIAAQKLGSAHTDGVDVDEQAVFSTKLNAENNRVQVNALLPDQLADGQYDVVVANILSNPLKMLAPMLCARVKPGGYLVLAGIFDWQLDEMRAAYGEYLTLEPWRDREGWVCLVGHKVN